MKACSKKTKPEILICERCEKRLVFIHDGDGIHTCSPQNKERNKLLAEAATEHYKKLEESKNETHN